MDRFGSRRRAATAALTVALSTMWIAGCEAGFQAQTDLQRSVIDGVNGEVGLMLIRYANIDTPPDGAYPAGSDARMFVSFYNRGEEADTFLEATTPAAASVEIRLVEPGGGTVDPGVAGSGPPAASSGLAGSPGAGADPSADSFVSASPVPEDEELPEYSRSPETAAEEDGGDEQDSEEPAGRRVDSLPVPEGGRTDFAVSGFYLHLRSLDAELLPGESVAVTFRFERNGEVTLQVPVQVPPSPLPRPHPEEDTE